MNLNKVSFSIAEYAAWAPGLDTKEAWKIWAGDPVFKDMDTEPGVRAMPPMLRRRADFLGKMALEVAYQCLGEQKDIPTVFCSRHGEVSRSTSMLATLAQNESLSPTSFSLSVHNAIGGLFSIARSDQANNIAIAAGVSTVENGVIEACGLLEDGASKVLLVVYDASLPSIYASFQDMNERAYSWAWLMEKPREDVITLSWERPQENASIPTQQMPDGLEILRFYLNKAQGLEMISGFHHWRWRRND